MLFFVGTARVKVGTRPNCAQAGFSGLRDGRAAVSSLRKRGSHSQMSPGDVDDGDGESGGEVPRWSVGWSVGRGDRIGLDGVGALPVLHSGDGEKQREREQFERR